MMTKGTTIKKLLVITGILWSGSCLKGAAAAAAGPSFSCLLSASKAHRPELAGVLTIRNMAGVMMMVEAQRRNFANERPTYPDPDFLIEKFADLNNKATMKLSRADYHTITCYKKTADTFLLKKDGGGLDRRVPVGFHCIIPMDGLEAGNQSVDLCELTFNGLGWVYYKTLPEPSDERKG